MAHLADLARTTAEAGPSGYSRWRVRILDQAAAAGLRFPGPRGAIRSRARLERIARQTLDTRARTESRLRRDGRALRLTGTRDFTDGRIAERIYTVAGPLDGPALTRHLEAVRALHPPADHSYMVRIRDRRGNWRTASGGYGRGEITWARVDYEAEGGPVSLEELAADGVARAQLYALTAPTEELQGGRNARNSCLLEALGVYGEERQEAVKLAIGIEVGAMIPADGATLLRVAELAGKPFQLLDRFGRPRWTHPDATAESPRVVLHLAHYSATRDRVKLGPIKRTPLPPQNPRRVCCHATIEGGREGLFALHWRDEPERSEYSATEWQFKAAWLRRNPACLVVRAKGAATMAEIEAYARRYAADALALRELKCDTGDKATRFTLSAFQTPAEATLALWMSTIPDGVELERPTRRHAAWWGLARGGGAVWLDPEFKGVPFDGVCIDWNSMYGCCMRQAVEWPLDAGEFRDASEFQGIIDEGRAAATPAARFTALARLPFGTYRTTGLPAGLGQDPHTLPRWVEHRANLYSHGELKQFVCAGLPFRLAEGEGTCLIHHRKIRGKLFTEWARTLFDLRYGSVPGGRQAAKPLLSSLWGKLGQRTKLSGAQRARVLSGTRGRIPLTWQISESNEEGPVNVRDVRDPMYLCLPQLSFWVVYYGRQRLQSLADLVGRSRVRRVHTDSVTVTEPEAVIAALTAAKKLGDGPDRAKIENRGVFTFAGLNRYSVE